MNKLGIAVAAALSTALMVAEPDNAMAADQANISPMGLTRFTSALIAASAELKPSVSIETYEKPEDIDCRFRVGTIDISTNSGEKASWATTLTGAEVTVVNTGTQISAVVDPLGDSGDFTLQCYPNINTELPPSCDMFYGDETKVIHLIEVNYGTSIDKASGEVRPVVINPANNLIPELEQLCRAADNLANRPIATPAVTAQK